MRTFRQFEGGKKGLYYACQTRSLSLTWTGSIKKKWCHLVFEEKHQKQSKWFTSGVLGNCQIQCHYRKKFSHRWWLVVRSTSVSDWSTNDDNVRTTDCVFYVRSVNNLFMHSRTSLPTCLYTHASTHSPSDLPLTHPSTYGVIFRLSITVDFQDPLPWDPLLSF